MMGLSKVRPCMWWKLTVLSGLICQIVVDYDEANQHELLLGSNLNCLVIMMNDKSGIVIINPTCCQMCWLLSNDTRDFCVIWRNPGNKLSHTTFFMFSVLSTKTLSIFFWMDKFCTNRIHTTSMPLLRLIQTS